MLKVSGKLKIYLYSAIVLTVAAIILCSLCYLFAFDKAIGYFTSASPLPYLLTALCIVCGVWFLSSVLFLPKGALDGASPTTLAVSIAAIPASIISILLGALMISASAMMKTQNIFVQLFPSFRFGNSHLFLLFTGIFLVLTAIYFAATWTVKKESREMHALIGFALPLAALLLIACTYFDLYVTMNSPVKLIFQSSMVSFMLYSTYELRIPLEKPKPRAYFFLGLLTLFFTGIASIPQIVAYAAGAITNLTYLFYALFALGIFVYTLARLCIFVYARDLLERIADQTPNETELPELDSTDKDESAIEETKETETTEQAEPEDPEKNEIEE